MSDEVQPKFTWPCPGKPEDLKGQPIGMYHCEYCGEMQIAGLTHLYPQFPEQWQEPFPLVEPEIPPLYEVLQALDVAAEAEDSAETLFFLEAVLKHPIDVQQPVWDALHAHRDDKTGMFIMQHLNMTKDDKGNWVVQLKED